MRLSGDDERRSAGEWLAQIWREHRWAARRLSKHPAFTAVVILTLGLAIGGNAAIYSVVSSVLLKPLPYPDPDSLVRVFAQHPRFVDMPLPPADFHALREQTEAFSGVAAFYREGHEFRGSAGPENLEGLFVTAGYFELLGTRAALGRTFTEEDERPGGADRVILSDRIWRTRLGADPAIIGRTVNLSRRPFEVIGVIAPGLEHVGGRQRSLPHGETVDFWIPLTLNPANLPRSARLLNTVGRLAHGRVHRAGKRGARSPGKTPGAAVAGLAHRLARQRRASGRRHRRLRAAGPLRGLRGGRLRPAHRLRQRRLSDARTIDCADA